MWDRKEAFLKTLKEEWLPELRAAGFAGRAWELARVRGPYIDCLYLQLMKDGSSCCVNLGVHPKHIPTSNDEAVPDPRSLHQSDCIVQSELVRKGIVGIGSHWWDFKNSSARDLVATYGEQGESFFRRYSEIPGPFASLTLDVLEDEQAQMEWVHPGYFGRTSVGLSIFLARLHESLGDRVKAAKFAEWGLNNLPKNLPRKNIIALLERNKRA